MEVVDHEPHFWFLLREDGSLFLDVACEHSAVSYNVLIQLNDEETARYSKYSRQYLSELAESIHYSAPGVRGSTSLYKSRNVSSKYDAQVMAAVTAWRTAHSSDV